MVFPSTEMNKRGGGMGFGQKTKSSVWDMLSER